MKFTEIDGGGSKKNNIAMHSIIYGEVKKKSTKTSKTPNRNNNPGFPIFIRRDYCAISLSTRNSDICLGRSSDFPYASAAFPPDVLFVSIPEIISDTSKKGIKPWAVALHTKTLFPVNTMGIKDYSGGPVPDFNGVPCSEIQIKRP